MSAVNEALVRYIDRLEEENRALARRVQELTPKGTVSSDIKKALHDASNLVGAKITYKITDSDEMAVKWVQEAVRVIDALRRGKDE